MRFVLVIAALLTWLPASWAEDVRLDLPETVELKAVVDYLAGSLGLNVLYDEAQLKKSVSLHISEPVPRDALPGLLRTILRSGCHRGK